MTEFLLIPAALGVAKQKPVWPYVTDPRTSHFQIEEFDWVL